MTVSTPRSGLQASPRSSAEIREQLADLAEVKKRATAYGTPDFSSQLGLQSILDHERELLEELRAAELLESNNAAAGAWAEEPR